MSSHFHHSLYHIYYHSNSLQYKYELTSNFRNFINERNFPIFILFSRQYHCANCRCILNRSFFKFVVKVCNQNFHHHMSYHILTMMKMMILVNHHINGFHSHTCNKIPEICTILIYFSKKSLVR